MLFSVQVNCRIESAMIFPARILTCEKKKEWLQKAKVIVIYSQVIMLDNNTIRVSLFR